MSELEFSATLNSLTTAGHIAVDDISVRLVRDQGTLPLAGARSHTPDSSRYSYGVDTTLNAKNKPRTHISDTWVPTPKDVKLTLELLPWVDVDAFVASFLDYWRSQGKAHADWDATYRNHVRRTASSGYSFPRRERKEW